MNLNRVAKYIESYKQNFKEVSTKELYKWKAVKQFQDNWDLDAEDFAEMLKIALSKVANLMDSGSYYPKKMLLLNASISPEKIRTLFKSLYNEEESILTRIINFKEQFNEINGANFKGRKSYQDDRAIVVYLTLKYPNQYYFYKYEMVKSFVKEINYPYNVVRGRIENVSQFLNLCENIKPLLSEDQELLKLHNNRLTEDCYIDDGLNMLTQDFVYAVVNYFQHGEDADVNDINSYKTENTESSEITVYSTEVNFTPSVTNYIEKNKVNKRIGDLGELFIMNYEKERLIKANKPKKAENIKHSSVEEGDGLGYDIYSYNSNGDPIFIEVKTTKGNADTPFFITRNELERSKQEQENYFIYRVYNFNDKTLKGDLLIIKGDASNLCVEPVNYKIRIKNEQ